MLRGWHLLLHISYSTPLSLPYLLLLSIYFFCRGHWVCGTETGLSILFLYDVKHRKTHQVSQALGGAICNANISTDSPPWLCACLMWQL